MQDRVASRGDAGYLLLMKYLGMQNAGLPMGLPQGLQWEEALAALPREVVAAGADPLPLHLSSLC